MTGLQFPISELIRETQALRNIAIEYLDQDHIWVLDRFISRIESIWSAAEDSKHRLELKPLHTISAEIKGQKIYAVCRGIWDVSPLGDPKRNSPGRKIKFCGIASTKVELYKENDTNTPISMWRLELGSHDSPGAYFHCQVLGESTEPPFPNSVPIPRLPSLFITPMAAIEYVIGELFQDEWSKAAMSASGDALHWRGLQKDRLKLLLKWYQDSLTKLPTSPWMSLKSSKPQDDMFIS